MEWLNDAPLFRVGTMTTPGTQDLPKVPEPTDHSLLRRIQGRDQDAATLLYQRYVHRLRALVKENCSADLARRVEVDDVVQSVFGAFFHKAGQNCYQVALGEELWGLFLVIALNKIRSKAKFHAAARRDVRVTSGDAALEMVPADRDEEEAVFLHMVIKEALETLPSYYQLMVELRLEGHEVADIARTTSRSKRTVERVLQEFRKRLEKVLSE